MNLLTDPWIPADSQLLTPATVLHAQQMTWPRPDLDAAANVFLIGLLQTAIVRQPELCPDENSWRSLRDTAPAVAHLNSWWQSVSPSFELLGNGPRFMQDRGDDFKGSEVSVATLLPECPGDNAIRKRSDIVRWHQEAPRSVSLPIAAAMLLADGLYGTRIGRGFRQGMRGENALLTLVEPDERGNLWARVWMNVLSYDRWTALYGERAWRDEEVFPWMDATVTSRHGEVVTPDDVNPLQAFWQMPRRNRLLNPSDGVCAISGTNGPVISALLRDQYGPNYDGWRHPLSPRHQDKEGTWSAVKIRRPHVGYDHWAGLALMAYDRVDPAPVVTENVQRRMAPDDLLRLRCCGWHLGSAGEAGTWVDATVPLVTATERVEFESVVARLLEAAALLSKHLGGALSAIGASNEAGLYASTDGIFYESLRRLAKDPSESKPLKEWLSAARRTAMQLFDQAGDSVRRDPLKVAQARARLRRTLYGSRLLETLGVVAEPVQ
jgi:CRISPR system Cascade subunit CasA